MVTCNRERFPFVPLQTLPPSLSRMHAERGLSPFHRPPADFGRAWESAKSHCCPKAIAVSVDHGITFSPALSLGPHIPAVSKPCQFFLLKRQHSSSLRSSKGQLP